MAATEAATVRTRTQTAAWTWWGEASGSVADLGVLVPISVALIVTNGLSATAVFLPAALGYLLVSRVYRLPISVQPLKAFGAVAIAAGLGPDVIAAGSLLMGVTFVALGTGNWLNRLAGFFPLPVIRGVQLTVGVLFVKIAWGLISRPTASFTDQLPPPWLSVATLAVLALLLLLRRRVILLVVLAALVLAVLAADPVLQLGPSALVIPSLTLEDFATAAVLLVLPQIPLTFANSCLAPADAAATYFGPAAWRVTPGRLARTLGSMDVLAGAISGMPVCHGAGGLSAHYGFGARTWRAPMIVGAALLLLAVVFGDALATVLPAFPLPVLASLLVVAGVTHLLLLKDLRGFGWVIAVAVGVVGALGHLALAIAGGLVLAWVADWVARRSAQSPPDRRALKPVDGRPS